MQIYRKISAGIISGAIALSFGVVALAEDQVIVPMNPPVPVVKPVIRSVGDTASQVNETRKKEMEAFNEARKKEAEKLKEARQKEMENIKEARQNELEKLKENRRAGMKEIKDIRADRPVLGSTTPKMVKDRMEVLKKEQEQVRERFKQDAEQARENMKQAREKAQEAVKQDREKIKEKVGQLRDERKKKMAEQIVGQFDRINKTETDHFMNVLDQDSAILLKIKGRADKALALGKDTTAVNTAVVAAQAVIDSAKTVVTAQAAKTYTVDPATIPNTTVNGTTTSALDVEAMKAFRSSFNVIHEQLKNELKTIREGVVKKAHESVRAALTELQKIPGVNQVTPPVATTTSTQ